MSDFNAPANPFRAAPSAKRSRAALLGAVAAAALLGAFADASLGFPPVAHAAAALAQTAQAGPGSFADVVDRVKGAVVSVKVKITESGDETDAPATPRFAPGSPMEKFFRQFGDGGNGNGGGRAPRSGMAQGSGFFISADGYIVTNNHVIDHATEVSVTMSDGRTLAAKVIGADPKTDLALLKVKDADAFPFVAFASKQPRVGDWVLAVGNPFGLGGTVTAGIVSARGRDIGSGPYDDYLQIDAPVNRGNSGGPTFNQDGEVVGVNTAIYSPSGGSVGIGFAITADVTKDVVAALRDKGSVARGWIGVSIQPVSEEIADSLGLKDTKGALVSDTQKNSPAGEAGIKSGDVITAVGADAIASPRDLAKKIAALGPEKKTEITLLRGGAAKTVSLTLGSLPAERVAKAETAAPEKSSLAGLGIELAPAASVSGAGKEGVVVTDIDADGDAARKGLRSGDVILEAAGKPVARVADVTAALAEAKRDGRKAVLLRVKSGDAVRFVALAPSARG